MSETVLEVRNLSKSFLNSGGKDTNDVLNDLSLSVERKEFLCILGPSGCGKTTLLRCVAGFETYTGEILTEGRVNHGPGTDRIMVFQDFNQLFPWKSVEKNIQYALKMQGIKDKALLKKKSDEALHKVKLDGYQNYYPYQLSGGMKQRVAIAKAFCRRSCLSFMMRRAARFFSSRTTFWKRSRLEHGSLYCRTAERSWWMRRIRSRVRSRRTLRDTVRSGRNCTMRCMWSEAGKQV